MLKPAGNQRASTEEPAKRWFQATGLPLCVEAGRQAIEPVGPVHVVLDVFLARPHDLDRSVDLPGDLRRPLDAVDFEPAAEAAADQVLVQHDFLERQAGHLGRRRLGARRDLGADPDVAAVLAHVHRAVHRLHRGVRQERHLIGRLDLGGRAGQRPGRVAGVLGNRARP